MRARERPFNHGGQSRRKHMPDAKQSEKIVNRAMLAPVVVAEWRSVKVDVVKFTDKKGGRREAVVARHGVEVGPVQMVISEWLPDGTKPETVSIPFKKGEMVILNVTEYTTSNGQALARGILERL